MIIFRLGENLDDTILQEKQRGGIITWLLKQIVLIILFNGQIIDDIVQSIVFDASEIFHFLNAVSDKPLHSVLVAKNGFLQLILKLWKFNLKLVVMLFSQHCQSRVFWRLNRCCPFTPIDERYLTKVVTWSEIFNFHFVFLLIHQIDLASTLGYQKQRIGIWKLLNNNILWFPQLGFKFGNHHRNNLLHVNTESHTLWKLCWFDLEYFFESSIFLDNFAENQDGYFLA